MTINKTTSYMTRWKQLEDNLKKNQKYLIRCYDGDEYEAEFLYISSGDTVDINLTNVTDRSPKPRFTGAKLFAIGIEEIETIEPILL